MGLGRTVRSGLKGKITQAHFFFHLGLSPSQLTLQCPNCPFHGWHTAATGPQRGQQIGGSSDLRVGWRYQGHLPPAGVGRGGQVPARRPGAGLRGDSTQKPDESTQF